MFTPQQEFKLSTWPVTDPARLFLYQYGEVTYNTASLLSGKTNSLLMKTIPLDKREISDIDFPYFSKKTYVVGTH